MLCVHASLRLCGRAQCRHPCARCTQFISKEQVIDYMTPSSALITLSPEQPLKEAAQTLLDAKITGAPVVEEGAPV